MNTTECKGTVQDKDVLKGTVVVGEKEYRATKETRKEAALLNVGDAVEMTVTTSAEKPEIVALKVLPSYRQQFNGATIGMAINLAAARIENHSTNHTAESWASAVCENAEALLKEMKKRRMS